MTGVDIPSAGVWSVYRDKTLAHTIRSPIFAFKDTVNAMGWSKLLAKGRDIVIAKHSGVKSVFALPRGKRSVSAFDPINERDAQFKESAKPTCGRDIPRRASPMRGSYSS